MSAVHCAKPPSQAQGIRGLPLVGSGPGRRSGAGNGLARDAPFGLPDAFDLLGEVSPSLGPELIAELPRKRVVGWRRFAGLDTIGNRSIRFRQVVHHEVADDRKSVVSGKSVSVRVDLGGSRIIKKKKTTKHKRDR